MSSTYGNNLKLSIWGESHGPAIGMVLDGIPAGLPVDFENLQDFLNRRAPGKYAFASQRNERDCPEFLSGIKDGYTSGTPITATIQNTAANRSDYAKFVDIPRPGHADFTAHIKYRGYHDVSGGGHFSGRLTAPMCIAGGLCMQWLKAKDIEIAAHVYHINGIEDNNFDLLSPQIGEIQKDFPVISPHRGQQMVAAIQAAKEVGDSIGGEIECAVIGLPAGLGDPMFHGMESRIAQIIYAIPAVKGLEFGLGFSAACQTGSQNNDTYMVHDGNIVTKTNRSGGILGGITTGMPLVFRVAIKPTPSIALPQQSVCLSTMQETTMQVTGRHDPCIVPRAVPVIEAAASIAIFDALLSSEANQWK